MICLKSGGYGRLVGTTRSEKRQSISHTILMIFSKVFLTEYNANPEVFLST